VLHNEGQTIQTTKYTNFGGARGSVGVAEMKGMKRGSFLFLAQEKKDISVSILKKTHTAMDTIQISCSKIHICKEHHPNLEGGCVRLLRPLVFICYFYRVCVITYVVYNVI